MICLSCWYLSEECAIYSSVDEFGNIVVSCNHPRYANDHYTNCHALGSCTVYIMTRCWDRKEHPVGYAHTQDFHRAEVIVGYELGS